MSDSPDSLFPLLSDDEESVDKVRIELLKKATPARRIRLAFQMSEFVRELSYGTIKSRHANEDPNAWKILYIRACYGREWAERFKTRLDKGTE